MPPMLPLNALHPGQILHRHLVSGKGRTARAIHAQQAKRFWIGGHVIGRVLHFVNANALRPGRQPHGKRLGNKSRLLLLGHPERPVRHRPGRIIDWRGVGLYQPNGLPGNAPAAHRAIKLLDDVVDGIWLEVKMGREGIKIVIVVWRGRIGHNHV